MILIPFSSASINQEGGCMSGELWSVLLFHFSITGLRSFPIQPQNFSHIDHSCLHVQLQTSFIFLADQNFKIKNQLVLIIFKTYRDLWNSKFSFVNKSDTNIINLLFTNISKHTVWTYSKRFILDSLLLKHSWYESWTIYFINDQHLISWHNLTVRFRCHQTKKRNGVTGALQSCQVNPWLLFFFICYHCEWKSCNVQSTRNDSYPLTWPHLPSSFWSWWDFTKWDGTLQNEMIIGFDHSIAWATEQVGIIDHHSGKRKAICLFASLSVCLIVLSVCQGCREIVGHGRER